MASEDRVGAIIYTNDDVDSTALRCCLAHEDFVENPMACEEDVVETTEYEFDEEATPGERCSEVMYTQTNGIAPGLVARVVTVITGERIETSRAFVGDDVCCVEIMQGCAA